MTYRRYTVEEIQALLHEIDVHLNAPSEIILIGGAAALLAYKATRLTHDIDILNDVDEVESAYEKAKEETGLDIPFSKAAVAETPYKYDERLTTYDDIPLANLIVRIPEIHDLILMKTIRSDQHDLEVIEEIAQKNLVDKEILIHRFETEMGHVIANPARLRINFAAVLARCFGEDVAENWMSSTTDKSQ